MVWGTLLNVLGSFTTNPALSAGVKFLSAATTGAEAASASSQYKDALKMSQDTAVMQAKLAAQRAKYETALKSRLLSQTGELGQTLRSAQTAMGAMPQVNQQTINNDYAATKSTMLNDFNDMLRLVESQGRTNQIDRLGGAGSMSMDDARMSALIKKYSPELQKIDDAAYDSAVSRASNTQNLIATNRQNTLNELAGVIQPQIANELQLLGTATDTTGLSNANQAYTNEIGDYASNIMEALGYGSAQADVSDSDLDAQIAKLQQQKANRNKRASPYATGNYAG